MSNNKSDEGGEDDMPDGWVGHPDDIPEMEPIMPLSTAQVFREYIKYIDDIGGVQNAERGDLYNALMTIHFAAIDEARAEEDNESA